MNFHIVIGDNFITSDNTVVGVDGGMQLYIPISSNYCIAFQHDFINCSKEITVEITAKKRDLLISVKLESQTTILCR